MSFSLIKHNLLDLNTILIFKMAATDDDEPYEMEYNPSNGRITARGRAAGRDLLWQHLQNENKIHLQFENFHSIGVNGGISIFSSEVIEFICRLVGYNLGVQVNSRIEFD